MSDGQLRGLYAAARLRCKPRESMMCRVDSLPPPSPLPLSTWRAFAFRRSGCDVIYCMELAHVCTDSWACRVVLVPL